LPRRAPERKKYVRRDGSGRTTVPPGAAADRPGPLALPAAVAAPAIVPDPPTDADASDEQLVALWLHGRAPLTVRAYRREACACRRKCGVKVTVIRDTLGHSSIAITDRYAHARPEESSGLALAV
jgi:hypothetical protein